MDKQDIESIRENLKNKKSATRRKAAIYIGKNRLYDLGEGLLQAYILEREDSRTWETQKEMITALGLIDYKTALSEIELVCLANEEHSAITSAAAEAYVRLKRKSLKDAKPAIDLIRKSSFSTIHGCYDAIGYDKMLPDDDEIKQLIDLSYGPACQPSKGYIDLRYGLAAAAAGWKKELVQDFLLDCLQSNDEPLKYVASNSLKGKYVKLR